MSESKTRYARLAPLAVEERLNLAIEAMQFFQPLSYRANCEVLGKTPSDNRIEPFDGMDFIRFLELTEKLPEANRYIYLIKALLLDLEKAGLLSSVGAGRNPMSGGYYYAIKEFTELERKGFLWLARALGPDLVRYAYQDITVQITGTTTSGDVHAGTGLVISEHWILTAAHVVNEMEVDGAQSVCGQPRTISQVRAHDTADVALIEIDEPLYVLPDLGFRNPWIAEPIYTLGYPRIPLSREPSLVMQSGEVTTTSLITLAGQDIFLYSAIARPGNSGGPVISASGHVVGIVTEALEENTTASSLPFHAGVHTSKIVDAIAELDAPVSLPVERYE